MGVCHNAGGLLAAWGVENPIWCCPLTPNKSQSKMSNECTEFMLPQIKAVNRLNKSIYSTFLPPAIADRNGLHAAMCIPMLSSMHPARPPNAQNIILAHKNEENRRKYKNFRWRATKT